MNAKLNAYSFLPVFIKYVTAQLMEIFPLQIQAGLFKNGKKV